MTTDRPTIFDHERAHIRTLEAELAQARADARVLAAWADKTVRLERGDRQPTAGRDVIEALERNKP